MTNAGGNGAGVREHISDPGSDGFGVYDIAMNIGDCRVGAQDTGGGDSRRGFGLQGLNQQQSDTSEITYVKNMTGLIEGKFPGRDRLFITLRMEPS